MTQASYTPTFAETALRKIVIRMQERRESKAYSISPNVTGPLLALLRVVFHLAGFGLLTFAGFTISMTAGLVIASGSCFVMSKLVTARNTAESEVRHAPDLRTGR